MAGPTFLPWLRRGLARGLGEADPRTGPLPARGSIEAAVTVVDDRGGSEQAGTDFSLLGPGDVTGLDPAQIVRLEPPDGATGVEANYLPQVELLAPDLPWLLTPAVSDADGAVRPWFVLICVEADLPGVSVDAAARPCPVLRLDGETASAQLPDLDESWAWAHVHSLVPADEVPDEVERGSGAVTARLLCPRRLREGRRYRAAIVPAFDAGRDAGLGRPVDGAAELGPAWDRGSPAAAVELPMYATWTFETSAVPGDFESLCRRLQPDTEGGRLGFRAARVVDDGLLPPFADDTGFEYEGPLVDPRSHAADLSSSASTWFEDGLIPVLERGASRQTVDARERDGYRPARDDPLVAPPLYGSWAADTFSVPESGWLRVVNVRPARRAPAGLGARLVREHEDELLAAAWDQVGEVRALRDELNRARLAAEVGRSHARRLGQLDDAKLLQATSRLHAFVPTRAGTAAQSLAASAVVPSALVSAALQRQVRPGGPVGRRLTAGAAGSTSRRPLSVVTAAFVDASGPAASRPASAEQCARFGSGFVPDGAVTQETVFTTPGTFVPAAQAAGTVIGGSVAGRSAGAPGLPAPAPSASRVVPSLRRLVPVGTSAIPATPDDDAELVAVEPVREIVTDADDDVREVAGRVRARLDPMRATVEGLVPRLSGVDLDARRDLPTRVVVGARFDTPLVDWLVELGVDLLVPGIDEFASNRARLLAVSEGVVAAVLVGANNEWAKAALYREYPADLGATAFSTFWRPVVPDRVDLVDDLHTWRLGTSLESHVGGEGASTVLLVRGDVIRRYPATEFLLVAPDEHGTILEDSELPAERTTRPAFSTQLDPATVVVGFDVDPKTVLDGGWYLGLEEPETGPRFGLDLAADGDYRKAPASWDDLSWGNVVASAGALDTLEHLSLAAPTWLAGVELDSATWGRNAAHVAATVFQRPFRLLFPASYLMRAPEGGGAR